VGLETRTYWSSIITWLWLWMLTSEIVNIGVIYCYDRNKWQTCPFVKEGAPHQQNRNCLTATEIWSWAPDGAWNQDWLINWLSCNVTLTLTG
jgi:hypothetical protein